MEPLTEHPFTEVRARVQERALRQERSLGDHGIWKSSWSLLRRFSLERSVLQRTLRRHNLESVSGLMLLAGKFLVEVAINRGNLWLQRHAVEVLVLEDSKVKSAETFKAAQRQRDGWRGLRRGHQPPCAHAV